MSIGQVIGELIEKKFHLLPSINKWVVCVLHSIIYSFSSLFLLFILKKISLVNLWLLSQRENVFSLFQIQHFLFVLFPFPSLLHLLLINIYVELGIWLSVFLKLITSKWNIFLTGLAHCSRYTLRSKISNEKKKII